MHNQCESGGSTVEHLKGLFDRFQSDSAFPGSTDPGSDTAKSMHQSDPYSRNADNEPASADVVGDDRSVAKIPESTQASLRHRLTERARERWPSLSGIQLRFRAGFA